ncbi:MAG TPA: hypothetical protein DEB31_11090, partial [Clostridiales bacterium]|nr:hypothetical protein [Clostridiales bacterium]
MNKGRLAAVIGVTAAAIVAVVLCVRFWPTGAAGEEPPQETPQVTRTTFDEGVTVGGVDVAGLTLDEARIAISPVIAGKTSGQVQFTVNVPEAKEPEKEETVIGGEAVVPEPEGDGDGIQGTEEEVQPETPSGPQVYTFALDQVGVSVDPEPVLMEALAYERPEQESTPAPSEGETQPAQAPVETVDFPLSTQFDEAAATALIEQMAADGKWTTAPINSSHSVKTTTDNEDLTTWGEIVESAPVDGERVKTEDIISTIAVQAQTGEYAPFEVQNEIIPASSSEDGGEQYYLMGTATTSFAQNRPEGRRFNIWKISSILNGARLDPGETFSVNDYVGPRNKERGWAEAMGIEDGNLTPQYGGGICQVSSTMYNAALKAEMTMEARVPHTIAAAYVKPGLDATISTGGPDFKLSNPYDKPVYVIVKCDVPESSVTVEFYGTVEKDYYLTLDTELVSDPKQAKPAPVFERSADVGEYEVSEERRGREYKKYQIYATKLSKADDSVIEEKIPMGTSTYNEIIGKYLIGALVPEPTPGITYEELKAQADALALAAAPPPEEAPPVDPGATPTDPA